MRKKIAVVGAGYWGKNLVRNFFDLGVLKIVCDQDPAVLKALEDKYPGLDTTAEYEEVLKHKDIEAVVIATPAAVHYRMSKDALLNSKHIFVEKPLALEVTQGRELVDLAAAKKRLLMVGHLLQYHGAVIKLKELIEHGELGRIQYIYSNRLNIGKIRKEENILWSFAPHDISVILMLLDSFPLSVYASAGTYLQENIPDVTVTTMDFARNVKAKIFVSWLHPFKEQKLVVIGDKKMAVFDDLSEEKLFIYPHKVNWIDKLPVAQRAEAQAVKFDMQEPLKNECLHFLECLENGLTPRTDGNEGLRVLEVLDAFQESLTRGEIINLEKSKGANDMNYFVHPSSYVDEQVSIGEGTRIWHFSHILKGSRIGKNCKIGQNVSIGPDASIGDNCKIQNNVSVYQGVSLEDDVFCGPSCVFTNVFNPRSAIPRMEQLKKTLVKQGATIGANATIICGVTIGKHAFIGAGAVVTKDVADYALVYGNPAHQHGWVCACAAGLKPMGPDQFECRECAKLYLFKDNRVIEKVTDETGDTAGIQEF